MKIRKTKRRLRKPYKVLLVIMSLFLIFIGGRVAVSMVFDTSDPKYGSINDIETSDSESNDDILAPEMGDDYNLDNQTLTFEVLDVGQGQSIFLDYGDMEVLIDGGCPDYGKSVVNKIKDRVDGDLDYVIATHSHVDHIGGLSAVYDSFRVTKTIYGDLSSEQSCEIFEKDAKASGKFENDKDTIIDLGKNATLTIYDVTDDDENTNNNSVICLIQYGETYFFCSGDAEKNIEKKLRTKIPQCSVVVAGHHGSSTSNTLLDILAPEYFVISAGRKNDYGQPHKEVLEYAVSSGFSSYGTWKSGDISFISDGMSITCDADEDDMLDTGDAGAIK